MPDKDTRDTGANDGGVSLNEADRIPGTETKTGDQVPAGDPPDDYVDPPYEPAPQPVQAAPGQPYEYPGEEPKSEGKSSKSSSK